MCDFKPGDEVVWVGSDGSDLARRYDLWLAIFNPEADRGDVGAGAIFVVSAVLRHPHVSGVFGLCFEGRGLDCFPHFSFRKVQRRDLTAWLSTTHTIEEPKRKPAKAPA